MFCDLTQVYKSFQKLSFKLLITGIAVLFAFVGGMLLKAFKEIPDFMFSIKDQMLANKQFQDTIGQYNGYHIWFDKERVESNDTIPFSISIDGKYDSTFVKIRGKYYHNKQGHTFYFKQDTLYRRL